MNSSHSNILNFEEEVASVSSIRLVDSQTSIVMPEPIPQVYDELLDTYLQLRTDFDEKNAEIQRLRADLQEKDNKISELNDIISTNSGDHDFNALLRQNSADMVVVERELKDMFEQMNKMRDNSAALYKHIAVLSQKTVEKMDELDSDDIENEPNSRIVTDDQHTIISDDIRSTTSLGLDDFGPEDKLLLTQLSIGLIKPSFCYVNLTPGHGITQEQLERCYKKALKKPPSTPFKKLKKILTGKRTHEPVMLSLEQMLSEDK